MRDMHKTGDIAEFLEPRITRRPAGVAPEVLTWSLEIAVVYADYGRWSRAEQKLLPRGKAEFWYELRRLYPEAVLWRGHRDGAERVELLGVRYAGYYPPAPDRMLGAGFRYTGWLARAPDEKKRPGQ